MDAETVQEVVVAQVGGVMRRVIRLVYAPQLARVQAMTGGSGAGGIAKAIATEEAESAEAPAPVSTADKTAELQLRLDSIENQNEAIEERVGSPGQCGSMLQSTTNLVIGRLLRVHGGSSRVRSRREGGCCQGSTGR